MGRTLPSITQSLNEEQAAFNRFRRALRRSDQLALDELFVSARQHLAAAAYAADLLPMETFMLSMLLEEHSPTTGENAQNTAALLRERGIGRVLLVTSALHMHRALGLFERAGLRTYPAATDYEVRERLPVVRWLPSASALWGSGRAMKEWFGRFDPRA